MCCCLVLVLLPNNMLLKLVCTRIFVELSPAEEESYINFSKYIEGEVGFLSLSGL